MIARAAMGVFVAGAARRMLLLVAERLDAAERAAKFINLALIGELLALRQFDQFKNFVQLVNHIFERFGNFGGVGHRLGDGRGVRRTKIRRAAPLPLPGRAIFLAILLAAFWLGGPLGSFLAPLALRLRRGRRGTIRRWFSGGLGRAFRRRRGNFFRGC
jgi:hypothetical protein